MNSSMEALDLLLALRPTDLDGDELALAAGVPAEQRMAIEAADAALTALIGDWSDEEFDAPSFTGADILARAANDTDEAERPAQLDLGVSEPPTGSGSSWWVPVTLAASIAAAAFGAWSFMTPTETSPEMRPKSLVNDDEASRIALQFSVERDGAVLPGRNGASYGPADALAFRFDLAGEPGYVALLEVSDGDWDVVYPLDGATMALDQGVHVLSSGSGSPLVYRPDDGVAGTLSYVAVVLSEPVDPGRVVPGLLAAGLHRADLWPRPVVAVDAVTVTWE